MSQITQSPYVRGLNFHLLGTDLISKGMVVMGNGYLSAPEKTSGPPARQTAVCGDDVIYNSICLGGAITKISAAERPRFVLGQLIMFGIAIFIVTLVQLTLGLAT